MFGLGKYDYYLKDVFGFFRYWVFDDMVFLCLRGKVIKVIYKWEDWDSDLFLEMWKFWFLFFFKDIFFS